MDLGTRHQLHLQSLGQLLPLSMASFLDWMVHRTMSASLEFSLLLGHGQLEKRYSMLAYIHMWILRVKTPT